MGHLVSAPCGMTTRRLAEQHLRNGDPESAKQTAAEIEYRNKGRIKNGKITMPMLVVTPDGNNYSDQEKKDCEKLQKDLEQLRIRLGPQNYKKLVEITNTLGPEATTIIQAVERWTERHKDTLNTAQTLAGGAASSSGNRLDGFGKALAQYEDALNTYLLSKHSPAATRAKARGAAQKAFQELNSQFASELRTMANNPRYKPWIHNPYKSFAGGIESSIRSQGSPISSLPETQRLNRGLSATKVLGKGLVAIDIFGRSMRVAHSDNKDYTFAKEATSFAASMGTATIVAQGTAIGLSLVFAPGGLVLILSVAAVGALTAYYTDLVTRDLFDSASQALMD